MHELYKKYRPTQFKHVVGQDEAVRGITAFLEDDSLPHTLLFTGPSGCGKTTIARILQTELKCSDQDFDEKNAANFRGIDTVREIASRMNLSPMGGGCRIYLIDECHQLTKDAQNALLKMLEDTPRHVYFMLATTDPAKLLPTIVTRCTQIKIHAIKPKAMQELLEDVADLERFDMDPDVRDKIVEYADGSGRKALVLLESVIRLKDKTEQLEAIERNDHKAQAIELARLLMGPKPVWSACAAIIRELEDDPEGVRRLILGYASSVLLKSNNDRAFLLLDVFQHSFFESGKPGLVCACYAVCKKG